MTRHLVLVLLALFLFAPAAWAQTIEKDRRIEERKREDLKPTLVSPRPPIEGKRISAEPFVPPPFKEIYLVNLLSKRVTYGYDAAKSIVILMGMDEELIDLDSQAAYLREKGMLSGRFREGFDPMAPLRKGPAAHMFLQALRTRGGIVLHLFGPSERYALKELVFQGIMSPGHVNDLISGAELVQIMSQAAAYKAQRLPQEKR